MDDIVRDRRLAFTTNDISVAGVRRAVETRLKELQASTVDSTSEEYRLLVEAREFLERNETENFPPTATTSAVVPLSMSSLEKLIDGVVDRQRSERSSEHEHSVEAVESRTAQHTVAAVTKASQDFRRARSLPLAGLGGATATLWGSRETFGTDLSGVGTAAWSVGCAVILLFIALLFMAAKHSQSRDEEVLRNLYDPDVQSEALQKTLESASVFGETMFSRREYRVVLLIMSAGLEVRPIYYRELETARDVRTGRRMSTVDLKNAATDAGNLAIERFLAANVLVSVRHGPYERFTLSEHHVPH